MLCARLQLNFQSPLSRMEKESNPTIKLQFSVSKVIFLRFTGKQSSKIWDFKIRLFIFQIHYHCLDVFRRLVLVWSFQDGLLRLSDQTIPCCSDFDSHDYSHWALYCLQTKEVINPWINPWSFIVDELDSFADSFIKYKKVCLTYTV